ncbi:MAG: hypothetical protein HY063_04970 [Bacteroidetes bacterium]|nr:hypothetical protein [Bacteroidota bacterium]
MKKLFFALAFTGFLGAATVNTISAATHVKVFVKGGEDDKKKKKDCKKDSKCCSKDANASAGDKKTCAKGTGCCHAKTTSSSETKVEEKKTETQK